MATMTVEKPESRLWFLRSTGLFQDQTESILDWAHAQSREVTFARGDTLAEAATSRIYVLVDGEVKLRSFGETGKEKILDMAGPGDTFGPLDRLLPGWERNHATGGQSLATEAVAMRAGIALTYDIDEFKELIARRPAVVVNVSRLLGLKQRHLEIRLNRLLFRSSLGKVAGLLMEMAERYGEETAEGLELSIRLTHQEMASMIGIKRETVSECLAALELEELISTRKRRFLILKPAELDGIV